MNKKGLRIVLTGGASGLGLAIATTLQFSGQGHKVFVWDKKFGCGEHDVVNPSSECIADAIDLMDGVDILINCAGVNKIDWLEKFTEQQWDEVVDTNAKGIFMMTKAFLPELVKNKGVVLNIVSNAAHMPMTCSLAYNASKAAAHIMTQQLARELTPKYGITVFGIAPNKLCGTGMSESIDDQVVETRGWTKEYAHQYQLNGLLLREETPPESVADLVVFLLNNMQVTKYLSGCILPFGV